MKLEIVPHAQADRMEWNALVNGSGSGWAYHLHEAIGISWGNEDNLSFGIRDKNREGYVLVAQLHISDVEEWGERFRALNSQWGFCWADGLNKKEFKELTDVFKKHIDKLYLKWDIRSFGATLPPLANNWSPDRQVTVNPLMDFGFAPRIRYTYIVDLEKSAERVLGDCQQTTRNEIHRIGRSGKYHMERALSGEEGFRTWWKLHQETFARTGGTPVTETYARNVVLNLFPLGICDIWELKNAEGAVVANVTVMKHEGTAYYLWGSSVDAREIGVNKYLLLQSMLAFKDETEGQNLGHRWFETGSAYPYLREGKYKGLDRYKRCFGTFMHPIWCGWYEPPENRLLVHPSTWERMKWKGKVWGNRLFNRTKR